MLNSYWWDGWVVVVGGVVGPKGFGVSPWHFDNGALSNIDDVLADDGGLLHVLPLAVHLKFLTDKWDPSFMLKSYGWVVVVCGLQDFIVSPSPLWVNLSFELGWTGLGLGLGGLGTRGRGFGTRA